MSDNSSPSASLGPAAPVVMNARSGTAGTSVQAGVVHGGIHLTGETTFRPPPPMQLPLPPPEFVDRAGELARMRSVLADASSNRSPAVVVIQGPGGVGKTGLALAWLTGVSGHFRDGALYARLGLTAADGPEAWLWRWLHALGVPPPCVPTDRQELLAALWRTVAARRRLMMLIDDASGADDVALLPGTGSHLVVITTRRRLPGLTAVGAAIVSLRPMDDQSAAELLFRLLRICNKPDRSEQAAQAGPLAAHAARLVWRCGGLPLAIGAVAGRIAVTIGPATPLPRAMAEVIAELDRYATEGDTRLDETGDETSVSAALGVAYAGLSAGAARLYRLLALHVWSADLGAEVAAAVLEVNVLAVRAVLDEVAGAGLLTATGDRWVMHDGVWPYARAMAYHESGEERDAAQGRMLNYYRDTALSARAAATPYLTEPVPPGARVFADRAEALAWLEAEHRCLVAAARWAHEHGRHLHAWPIVHGMRPLYLHLRPSEWLDVDRLGLEAARATGDRAAEAEALNRLGAAYTHVGDYRKALAHYTMAMVLWRHLGKAHKVAGSLRHLADVAAHQDRHDDAIAHFREAIEQHQALGQPREAALGLIGLGQALTRAGRPDAALEPLNEAVAAFEQLTGTPREDPYNAARAASALGVALTALGSLDHARGLLRLALAEMRRLASRHGMATVCDALADLARRGGNTDEARAFTEHANGLRTDDPGT